MVECKPCDLNDMKDRTYQLYRPLSSNSIRKTGPRLQKMVQALQDGYHQQTVTINDTGNRTRMCKLVSPNDEVLARMWETSGNDLREFEN